MSKKASSVNQGSYKSLNKKQNVSDMLNNETKKMEEKLNLVKRMMDLEKDTRSQMASSGSGTPLWRGAQSKKNAVINTKSGKPGSKQSVRITASGSSSRTKKEEEKLNYIGTPKKTNNMNANVIINNQHQEVATFLSSIKLEKYYDKFIDHGVEDLETILELKDDHVEQIGCPLGHKLKIIKKIKDLRAEKGLSVLQSREGTIRKKTPERQGQNIEYAQGISSRPATQIEYEELPAPESILVKEPPAIPKSKTSHAGANPNDQIGIQKLVEGDYDEAESHNGFLEALKAWRVTSQKEKAPTPKKVNFKIVEPKQKIKIQMSTSNKESCWQCYKLYELDYITSEFKVGSKGFCSRPCYNASNALNSQACSLAGCKTRFRKADGAMIQGRWFCSEQHADKDPNVIKMRQIEAKIKSNQVDIDDYESAEGEIDL